MTLYIDNNDWALDYTWDVETEQIDVTLEFVIRPDPEWSFVDQQGHYHAFTADDEHNILPTLRGTFIEEAESVVYRCRICNTEVKPKWTTQRSTHRTYAPGKMSWRVELRAGRPHARLLSEMNGTSVSVRIEEGDTTVFGIGLLRTIGAGVGDDGEIKWSGCVYGNGPLASRKATR